MNLDRRTCPVKVRMHLSNLGKHFHQYPAMGEERAPLKPTRPRLNLARGRYGSFLARSAVLARVTAGLYYDFMAGSQQMMEQANRRFEEYIRKLLVAYHGRV